MTAFLHLVPVEMLAIEVALPPHKFGIVELIWISIVFNFRKIALECYYVAWLELIVTALCGNQRFRFWCFNKMPCGRIISTNINFHAHGKVRKRNVGYARYHIIAVDLACVEFGGSADFGRDESKSYKGNREWQYVEWRNPVSGRWIFCGDEPKRDISQNSHGKCHSRVYQPMTNLVRKNSHDERQEYSQ